VTHTFVIPPSIERFFGLSDPKMLKERGLTFLDVDAVNRMVVEGTPSAEVALMEEVRAADPNNSPWAGLAKAWARRRLAAITILRLT
jgi:hypothetical protein